MCLRNSGTEFATRHTACVRTAFVTTRPQRKRSALFGEACIASSPIPSPSGLLRLVVRCSLENELRHDSLPGVAPTELPSRVAPARAAPAEVPQQSCPNRVAPTELPSRVATDSDHCHCPENLPLDGINSRREPGFASVRCTALSGGCLVAPCPLGQH